MIRYTLLVLLICCQSVWELQANTTQARVNYIQGELIVQIQPNTNIFDLVEDFQRFEGQPTDFCMKKMLSHRLNIYLLQFNESAIDQASIKSAIFKHPMVKIAQNNHIIENRATIPNDPQFDNQWQYINTGANGGTVGADIDADLAWDIATGGLTALGDTIVVAVIDDGLDLSHQDFGDNLWVNHNEIPDNGIDDDGNGYIDDYNGWNIFSDNDNISGGGHGTPVAGIVGAKGDNNIGVAGVNWNVKLMIIRGGGAESAAVESYAYCLEERTIYNETNGTDGSYVVSTNASWGVDFGQPDDAPIWCSMYDELGAQGVVSCGATINGNQNVDEIGDLPTACPSDYLISVTNMNRNDVKVTGAGYGIETIDLGAFGQSTWTCSAGNNYGGFGGTSGATPHVAGAVALIYSVDCPQLALLSKTNPGEAALLVKNFILDGVDPNASLNGITTTGGRLNLNNTLELVTNYNCFTTGCFTPYSIGVSNVVDVSADFNWLSPEGANILFSYKPSTANVWNTVTVNDTTFTLTALAPCTSYDVQLTADCDSITSNPSGIITFSTDGCCIPPSELSMDMLAEQTAVFSWNTVLAAGEYLFEYRLAGANNWNSINNGSETSVTLNGLNTCATYEVQVASLCNNGETSSYSSIFTFNTENCGACVDNDYCSSTGSSSFYEWIEEVAINGVINNSGNNDGYAEFTDAAITMEQGNTINFSITPGYEGTIYAEYYKIWVDFDQDGTFGTQAELVYESPESVEGTTTGTFTIPTGILSGSTRMRISMKWIENDNTPPDACDTFTYGEVEDYCVLITEGPTNATIVHLNVLLEGAYTSAGTMSNNLSAANLLPQNQPFFQDPWNYAGSEGVDGVNNISPNATDWLLIELRSASDVNQMVAQRACLLLQDGSVLDAITATPGLNFEEVAAGNYYIVVRSRNHLAVLSANTVSLPNSASTPYDFTQAENVAGVNQLIAVDVANSALIAGDIDANGIINVSDYNMYIANTAILNAYNDADCNLDNSVTTDDFNTYLPNASKFGVVEVRY